MKDANKINVLREYSRKLVRELGMLEFNQSSKMRSIKHWHALIEVSRQPGITIASLAHLLLLSKSTLSRVVKALSEEELISTQSGSDKREKKLYITTKGSTALKSIDEYSEIKIKGAFEFITKSEQAHIISGIQLYAHALEKGRLMREQVKIMTLPTNRNIRREIVNLVENIQKNELQVDLPYDINISILKEEYYYYNHSTNFWYATNRKETIIGCVGLLKINKDYAELKKCFVHKSYRGKGVAEKLMQTLMNAATKHHFKYIALGTVNQAEQAINFYIKHGFNVIDEKNLPQQFTKSIGDNLFMLCKIKNI